MPAIPAPPPAPAIDMIVALSGESVRWDTVSFPCPSLVTSPGDSVPNAYTVTLPPIVPAPPSVAPADTVTAALPSAPSSNSVPALTRVVPP